MFTYQHFFYSTIFSLVRTNVGPPGGGVSNGGTNENSPAKQNNIQHATRYGYDFMSWQLIIKCKQKIKEKIISLPL